MKQICKIITLSVLSILIFGSSVHADLVLNVDTTNELVWFTGSDTGTPINSDEDDLAIVGWSQGGVFTGATDSIDLVNSVTASGGTESSYFLARGNNDVLSLELSVDTLTAIDPLTFTATGNTFSYAGWSAAGKATLESAIGSSLTPSDFAAGDAWGSVQIVAVPEPGSFSLFAIASLALASARRRRQF